MTIKLTQNEFELILHDSHPEYESDSDDKFLEKGKGSDVHYKRTIIRKEDNVKFVLVFTYNHGFEGYQDWIRSGDFEIDKNKKDIYDDSGELLEQKENKKEVVQEETIVDIYEKMEKEGKIDSIDSEEWLTIDPEDIANLYIEANRFKNKKGVSFQELSLMFYTVAVEYSANVNKLWHELFQKKQKILSKDDFKEAFRIKQELKNNNYVSFYFKETEVEFSKAELKKLKKILNTIEL